MSASVATATAATTSTHHPARASADRGLVLAQIAMLEQRAAWAGHARPGQQGAITGHGAITGRVVGLDGRPVAGACVTAVGPASSVTTAASPDGTFWLSGLPAGSYVLEYRDCAPAGRDLTSSSGYLTSWSGGTSTQGTAARILLAAGQVRHVPVMMLKPANPAAAIAVRRASFRRAFAAASRSLSAAAATRTGAISGKVTGKGKPLSGVCVAVTSFDGDQSYGAKTAKNGTYAVRNVVTGQYIVTFAPTFDCQNQSNWLQQVYKNDNSPFAADNDSGTAVMVRAGRKTAGISANLHLGGEISGTVTSESGARLHGICVDADARFGHRQFSGFAQTSATGSYQVHALFPGKYMLQFSIGCGSRGGNYAPATHRAVKLGYGRDVTINEALAPGASISGTATLGTSSGTPLAGICVGASNAAGSVTGSAATNRNGHYRVFGLSGGRFQLQFSPGCSNNGNYTTVSVTAHTTTGQQTRHVDAVLQVAGKITGTIAGSHGNRVSGVCVELVGPTTASHEVFEPLNNGSYLIEQLEAGTYQVGFLGGCGNRGSYAPDWYNNQPSENTATPIELMTGQTFMANAVLKPGATITGKVTNTAGNGLSGACVEAATQFDAEFGPYSFEAQTYSRNGTYRLSNLAPGQYLIDFGCGFGGRYADQWFPAAPDAGTAELVSVLAGRTSGINAVLKPGGSISGVVTGKAGRPLALLCVSAANTQGALPALRGTVIDGLVGLVRRGGQLGVTGLDGAYRISGLSAGRYQVMFGSCFGSLAYAGQWYRGKSSPLAATDVTVRAGKRTPGINGRLVLGGTISGRVISASGRPLRNICVFASSRAASVVVVGFTHNAGTYAIHGLNSGRYTVEFSPCANQNLVTVAMRARVTAPHATTGVNATMHSGGSIAGVVTAGSTGPTATDSCVEVFKPNSAEPVGFGLTGLDGSYLATGLQAGTYQVYFGDPLCVFPAPTLAPQWYSLQPTRVTAKGVTVTLGSTTPSIDAALQADGQITGTVSGPSAAPLSGACVTAVPLSASGSLPIVAVTGASGYTLADLLPGRYKVRFSSGCGAVGYASQWWKGASSKAAAKVITVAAGQDVSGVSAKLRR